MMRPELLGQRSASHALVLLFVLAHRYTTGSSRFDTLKCHKRLHAITHLHILRSQFFYQRQFKFLSTAFLVSIYWIQYQFLTFVDRPRAMEGSKRTP